MTRKGGKGEVGGCTQRVQTAWPRPAYVEVGWVISWVLFVNGPIENTALTLCSLELQSSRLTFLLE